MSFPRRKSFVIALLAAGVLTGAAVGAATSKATAPKLSGLHARVAQGSKVDLAASRYSPAELQALRPNYQYLKPRARSNAE